MEARHTIADFPPRGESVLHDQSSNGSATHALGIDSIPQQSSQQQSGPQPSRKRSCLARLVRTKRFWVMVVGALLLKFLIAVILAIVLLKKTTARSDQSDSGNETVNSSQSLTEACQTTLHPTVCVDSLSNLTSGGNSSSNTPQQMVQFSLLAAIDHVTREHAAAQTLLEITDADDSPQLSAALHDCVTFVQDSLDSLAQTLDGLQTLDSANRDGGCCLADLETWISASLTTQQTCLDGFDDLNDFGTALNGSSVTELVQQGRYGSMLLSNVLAFVATLKKSVAPGDSTASVPGHQRRLLDEGIATVLKRRLLKSAFSAATANVVVAQDGSGNYKHIQDAVNSSPAKSSTKGGEYHVIYIKAGKYVETVLVPKNASNLVFLGDGVGKTIISGNLSVVGSNLTTLATASLTVQGVNFVGRNFTVENTAGAASKQAVALRVAGDLAAFENCEFSGHQDTLYAHTNRQYYTNCTIVGTVDFIFGNAAAVFQNCRILASIGIPGQQNTYTASGRTDPNQNTGLSFQSCTFDGTDNLKNASGTFPTYLGRPWKSYARTVVMQSVEGGVLDPAGWLAWNGEAPNSTVYFGEYQNTGPGSDVRNRVPWSSQINGSNAMKFAVDSFIQGKNWLPQNGFTYIGLG